MKLSHNPAPRRQHGTAIVEFAFVVMILLTLVFGILEFGRFFYVSNSLQEVTRRAARAQTVSWLSQTAAIRKDAVFQPTAAGTVSLPAGAEVTDARVQLTFYNTYADALDQNNAISYGGGSNPDDNFNSCLQGNSSCIQFVRAALQNGDAPVNYVPMVGLFSFMAIPLPGSTVIMPAEALGLL